MEPSANPETVWGFMLSGYRVAALGSVSPADRAACSYAGNNALMLSLLWIRRIASPKSGATEMTSTFCDRTNGWVSIESVTRSRPIGLRSSRSIDPSLKTPWDTAAYTAFAPAR